VKGGVDLGPAQQVLHLPPCLLLLHGEDNGSGPDVLPIVPRLALAGLPSQNLHNRLLHQLLVPLLVVRPNLGLQLGLRHLHQLLRISGVGIKVHIQHLNLGGGRLKLGGHFRPRGPDHIGLPEPLDFDQLLLLLLFPDNRLPQLVVKLLNLLTQVAYHISLTLHKLHQGALHKLGPGLAKWLDLVQGLKLLHVSFDSLFEPFEGFAKGHRHF